MCIVAQAVIFISLRFQSEEQSPGGRGVAGSRVCLERSEAAASSSLYLRPLPHTQTPQARRVFPISEK